jgi:hypothetical protein
MTISFARHQFPPAIIRHAAWLYVRFTLSYRDVEDLLAERGLEVSYETVRRWVLKFGPLFARELRRRRSRPTARWHLDEMAVDFGFNVRLGVRELKALREMSPAAFPVSIETGSAFFRFQLGLIDPLIDRTMNHVAAPRRPR